MNFTDKSRSQTKFPPTTSSTVSNFPTEFNHSRDGELRRRRKGKLAITGCGIRLRKCYGIQASRGNGLTTPCLKWKFDDDDDGDLSIAGNNVTISRRRVGRRGGVIEVVSARKLATALWQLRLGMEIAGGDGKCGPSDRLGIEVESSLPIPKPAMEGKTQWDKDNACKQTSEETDRFYNHMKLLDDQQVATVSVISALQQELLQARTRIHKLEVERQSSKLKLEHFLRKLDEERISWRRREHQKIRKMVGDLKEELKTERNRRKRMEVMNSKLVNELTDAKLSAKQIKEDFEKERKSRKLTEAVCNELVQEIREDKARVEVLKRESMNICEEIEEERMMLQMAEVWREERVQMKLVDAKLTLEEKYSQMNELITHLETFLRSRIETLEVGDIREAESILQAVDSLNILDINQFSYVPPESNDIFSIVEELQKGRNGETQPCITHGPADCVSKLHDTTLDHANGFIENTMEKHSNEVSDQKRGFGENASGWESEIISHNEDQGSSNSLEGSDPSVNIISRGRNVSGPRTKWVENAGQESPSSGISEVCSLSAKQSKQKASVVPKLLRSYPSNGEINKMHSVELSGSLSNGSITSNVENITPAEGRFDHGKPVRQLSFPDSENPHITRAMKGFLKWSRSVQNQHGLKGKHLEAKVESQKIQMRHVLKQRS